MPALDEVRIVHVFELVAQLLNRVGNGPLRVLAVDSDVALDAFGHELVAEHEHVGIEDRGLGARRAALYLLDHQANAILGAGDRFGETGDLDLDLVRSHGAANE